MPVQSENQGTLKNQSKVLGAMGRSTCKKLLTKC